MSEGTLLVLWLKHQHYYGHSSSRLLMTSSAVSRLWVDFHHIYIDLSIYSFSTGWNLIKETPDWLTSWEIGVQGHGGSTPPLPVYLCDALLCPHLFWPASEAPPSEGPPQHPAKHHPDPDWWPGPGAGWVKHTYRLTLLFLQLMKLLISFL